MPKQGAVRGGVSSRAQPVLFRIGCHFFQITRSGGIWHALGGLWGRGGELDMYPM
jgi:hypothetical protein